MGKEIQLSAGRKALPDCTLADMKEKAGDAKPASVIDNNVSEEAFFALIVQEMEAAGAATVGDLGKAHVKQLEGGFGPEHVSADRLLKAIGQGRPAAK